MTAKTNPMLSPEDLINGESATDNDQPEYMAFYNIIDGKDGRRIKVNYPKLIKLLKHMGYRRYDIGAKSVMVQITDNIVQEVEEKNIIDGFEAYIKQFPDNMPDGVMKESLLDKLYAGISTYFSKNILHRLTDDEPIRFCSHTQREAFFYYKNGFTRVTKKGIELLPYSQLDGKIWKNQILDREFKVMDKEEWERGHFTQFIKNISNNWSKRPDGATNIPDVERYEVFRTILGYLLHSYFEGDLKAVVFTDSRITSDPDGRTGKTLIFQAMGRILNRTDMSTTFSEIPGKSFDLHDRFKYQQLGIDTRLVHLNDIQRNFSVEELFNDITEGIKRERKNESPVNIRAKIGISTNLTIRIHGGSALDRCLEFEMADYYSSKIKPGKEFKHWFFRDWNKEEWMRFDNLMLNCVSAYLEHGLREPTPINLMRRKLMEETAPEFVTWMDDLNITHEEEFDKKVMYEKFMHIHDTGGFDKWLKQRQFTNWMQLYAKFSPEYEGFTERRSNNKDFITYLKKDWE